jgi:hypothetical protein
VQLGTSPAAVECARAPTAEPVGHGDGVAGAKAQDALEVVPVLFMQLRMLEVVDERVRLGSGRFDHGLIAALLLGSDAKDGRRAAVDVSLGR